jgi:hypothetical protein
MLILFINKNRVVKRKESLNVDFMNGSQIKAIFLTLYYRIDLFNTLLI